MIADNIYTCIQNRNNHIFFNLFEQEFVITPATGDWIVHRKLARAQMARYIRFYPQETSPSSQACLRVEAWGRRGRL